MRFSRLVHGRQIHPFIFVLVGGVALTLFVLSLLIEVRVIVENPNYGDVTALLSTLIQAILGLTTVGSFLLAVYNYRADGGDGDGTGTRFTIRGRHHDIDVHLHVGDDDSEPPGNPKTLRRQRGAGIGRVATKARVRIRVDE